VGIITQVHKLKDYIYIIIVAMNCVYIITRSCVVFYIFIFIVDIYPNLTYFNSLNLNEIINYIIFLLTGT